MRTRFRNCAIVMLLLANVTTVLGEMWQSRQGQNIDAALVGKTQSIVVLRRTADGQYIRIHEGDLMVTKEQQLRLAAAPDAATIIHAEGNSYYHGEGVRQSFKKAIELYKFAYRLGSIEAAFSLGICYSNGEGVDQDYEGAKFCYEQAATQGHDGAQNNLGLMYDLGLVTDNESDEQNTTSPHITAYDRLKRRDVTRAMFWFEKAAAQGNPNALNNLGAIAQNDKMQPNVAADYYYRAGVAYHRIGLRDRAIACIDRLQRVGAYTSANQLRSVVEGTDKQSELTVPVPDEKSASAGTGWFVAKDLVVTCWHVVSDHGTLSIVSAATGRIPARLVAKDMANDVALLRVEKRDDDRRVLAIANKPAAAGDVVFTVGFPHIDLLGKAPKYTEGSVSSITGMDDDPRALQISVPIQSGNSGGPLLNAAGNVVGIITSKLAAANVFRWTGDMPQNVNYAVKAAYLRVLLDSLQHQEAKDMNHDSRQLTASDVANRAELVKGTERSVVLVLAE